MNSTLASQIETTQETNAFISFAKEAVSVLTLFACVAVPILLLSLTWAG
ncbi:hypothetical protein ACXJY6_11135 [Vibrio sp. RC27]